MKTAKVLTETMKKWIDEASYSDLLTRHRFSDIGDEIFWGDAGVYYADVMHKKKESIGRETAVAASKAIGWAGGNRLGDQG